MQCHLLFLRQAVATKIFKGPQIKQEDVEPDINSVVGPILANSLWFAVSLPAPLALILFEIARQRSPALLKERVRCVRLIRNEALRDQEEVAARLDDRPDIEECLATLEREEATVIAKVEQQAESLRTLEQAAGSVAFEAAAEVTTKRAEPAALQAELSKEEAVPAERSASPSAAAVASSAAHAVGGGYAGALQAQVQMGIAAAQQLQLLEGVDWLSTAAQLVGAPLHFLSMSAAMKPIALQEAAMKPKRVVIQTSGDIAAISMPAQQEEFKLALASELELRVPPDSVTLQPDNGTVQIARRKASIVLSGLSKGEGRERLGITLGSAPLSLAFSAADLRVIPMPDSLYLHIAGPAWAMLLLTQLFVAGDDGIRQLLLARGLGEPLNIRVAPTQPAVAAAAAAELAAKPHSSDPGEAAEEDASLPYPTAASASAAGEAAEGVASLQSAAGGASGLDRGLALRILEEVKTIEQSGQVVLQQDVHGYTVTYKPNAVPKWSIKPPGRSALIRSIKKLKEHLAAGGTFIVTSCSRLVQQGKEFSLDASLREIQAFRRFANIHENATLSEFREAIRFARAWWYTGYDTGYCGLDSTGLPLFFTEAAKAREISAKGKHAMSVEEDVQDVSMEEISAIVASAVADGKLAVVVLNACRTLKLAEALSSSVGVPFVVCWEGFVADEAALIFGTALASHVSDGEDYEDAFKRACEAVEAGGKWKLEEPQLKEPRLQPAERPWAAGVPRILRTPHAPLASLGAGALPAGSKRKLDDDEQSEGGMSSSSAKTHLTQDS